MAENVAEMFKEYVDTLTEIQKEVSACISKPGTAPTTVDSGTILNLAADSLITQFSDKELPDNIKLDGVVQITSAAESVISAAEQLIGTSNTNTNPVLDIKS